MLFVGDDWAEDHHDLEVQNETGKRLGKKRVPEGVTGLAEAHALIGRFAGEDLAAEQVVVGIETDRGPWVTALIAAGYTVYAINPRQVARHRERHSMSGAKSDAPGGACHGRCVSHGWAKIDRSDQHSGREGHPREREPARP